MLPLGLLLLATVYARGVDGSDCGCYGKCDNPIVNGTRDCPAVGYDCQRVHAALGLYTKYTHGDDVTLKCADSKATLFVKEKSQKKLKCRKGSGSWKGSCGCEATDSALCALPCTTCSTLVPGFLSLDAASISVIPAKVGQSCSIGFCNGIGLTLTGIDSSNTSVTIDGNLTCSGAGWMDRNGRVYSHAVCQYYGNCPAISLGAPSANTVSLLSSGGRSVSCPVGSFLTYVDPWDNTLQTRYSLVCGPNSVYQLQGMYWDASYFTSVTCTTYEPCTISIPPIDACAADNTLCRPASHTTVPFACTSKPRNIANVICASDVHHCFPAIVTDASISCPAGSTLIYEDAGEYKASMGNLTCDDEKYKDTDSTDYYSHPPISHLGGATCTNRTSLSCRRPPFAFTTGGIAFESTPGSYVYVALNEKTLTRTNGQWQMYLQPSFWEYALIYYNDNWANVAQQLRCGDDQMWHAPDNTVVTTATAQRTVYSTTPSFPEGYDQIGVQSYKGYCQTAIVYQTPGGSVQTLSVSPNTYILYTPQGNFALPVGHGYIFPPPGTLIGCTKT